MPRRGNHEGSIYHRADGRWEAKISLPDGRRVPLYGKTRAEAAQKLTQAQHDLQKGLPVAPEKQTVAQWLRSWLDMQLEIAPSTRRRYKDDIEQRLIPTLGKTVLTKLSAPQIGALYKKLLERYSPGTVHQTHLVLSHALSDAVRMRLLQYNEAKYIKPPQSKPEEMHPWSEEQANQFLAFLAEQQHRFEALYVLALTTGMRQGELLGLHWKEVYLERKLLRVVWNVKASEQTAGKERYYLGDTKTEGSTRTIHLAALAVEALRTHRARQKAEKLSIGLDIWQEHDLVFPNPWGALYSPAALYGQFIKLAKHAGLPRIRFHDLRHTAATILLARGIPVKQVSEMLGHSDIAITLRVYGHVLPAIHEQAASMMDEVFSRRA